MKITLLIKALNKAGLIMIILAASKFYGDSPITITVGIIFGAILFFIPSDYQS